MSYRPAVCSVIALFLMIAVSSRAATAPKKTAALLDFPADVVDFGHLGIDYTVHYRYPVINRSPDTIRVLNITVHCDCSSAFIKDTILAPGDSTNIHLRYSTRNMFGPQNKSITLTTDQSGKSTYDLYYLSIVGQWFNGIKPDPQSLMILPPQKSKTVAIPNQAYDWIELGELDQFENYFSVNVTNGRAKRSETLQLEVVPSPSLGKGTFESHLTLRVNNAGGEPVILTIPVKIVRY